MSYPEYLNLNRTVRARMAALKAAAEKLNSNPHRSRPDVTYTWRDMRYSGFHNAAANCCTLSQGFNTCPYSKKKIPVWYTHCGQQFTREIFADEFIGNHGRPLIDHTGWFSDSFASETTRGIVVSLPHGRFMAGYHWSSNGERVYFPEIYDCIRTAVYAADGHAEAMAEQYREDDEKATEAGRLQDTIAENIARLRECIAMRNNKCFNYVRDEIAELIPRIRDDRETLQTEFANYI